MFFNLRKEYKGLLKRNEELNHMYGRLDESIQESIRSLLQNSMWMKVSEQLNSKELLEIFSSYEYKDDFLENIDQYVSILEEAVSYLEKGSPYCFYNNKDSEERRHGHIPSSIPVQSIPVQGNRPLSYRQYSRAMAAMGLLEQKKYCLAYHEMCDCIRDYGEGCNEDKLISVNEYTIYKMLFSTFLYHLNSEKERTNCAKLN